jgi:hypothetical protein
MFKKFVIPALLATSALAFNGQAPAAFSQKPLVSEKALKMAGGVSPALKVGANSSIKYNKFSSFLVVTHI